VDEIRVAVVDDHPVVRESLAGLLQAHGMRVVAQGEDGRDAMRLCRRTDLDVVVLDLEMPFLSSIDALSSLRQHVPKPAILVLSAHQADAYAGVAMKRGARGFLEKSCDPAEIVEGVRTLAEGRCHLPAQVTDVLLRTVVSDAPPSHEELTARELQVMLRLARGQRSVQMARELHLSVKTISACRLRVLHKLGCRSPSEITSYALKNGLLN
jgi:two-component system invasion response regulator UvrY